VILITTPIWISSQQLLRLNNQMLNFIIRKAVNNPRIRRAMTALFQLYRDKQIIMSLDIPEITPIGISKSEILASRINLLVPGISAKAMFGGVSTALDVFLLLAKDFENVRIIVTDEHQPIAGIETTKLKDFVVASMEDELNGKVVVWAGDRYGKSMPVRNKDFFVATAWWTARIGFEIFDEQNKLSSESTRRLFYIIQDYEPNFYAWSSRFALAHSTYSRENDTVAIINSSLLANYLKVRGHSFQLECMFEPKLNMQLRERLEKLENPNKQRLIFVYGRPGVQRNAFELVVQSLRAWASSGKAAENGWTVVSAGEEHEDIQLGGGLTLTSLGKLSLDGYAELLEKSAVGLSLMMSPHPSYPPLELAAFGAGVVTNSFESKNLSSLHPSIHSVTYPDPGKLAEAIAWKCYEFELDNEINWRRRKQFGWPYLDSSTPFEPGDKISSFLRTLSDTI